MNQISPTPIYISIALAIIFLLLLTPVSYATLIAPANCTELKSLVETNCFFDYELNNSIDCSEDVGFTAMCSNGYYGTFDGQGYNITNLSITNAVQYRVSLFAFLSGAQVFNLNILNASLFGGDYAMGILAASVADSNITNCSTSGTVDNTATSFYISKVTDEGPQLIRKQKFGSEYSTFVLPLRDLENTLTIQVNQKTVPFADVEQISFRACGDEISPDYAVYVDSGASVLSDILKWDNNVTIVHEKPIEISWQIPDGCSDGVFILTANEYGSGSPVRFPELGAASYVLGSNQNTISVDGVIDEVDGIPTEYAPYWQPTTGHPNGYTYIYVSDDSENVYFSLDITSDNTNEFGHDWASIEIDGKTFLINDTEDAYGKCAFGMTSRVGYNHQTCEFAIPKSELSGPEVQFKVKYYGTLAMPPTASGGLAGHVSGNSIIDDSYSIVNVSGRARIGGLVGYLEDSTINNSYAIGNVFEDPGSSCNNVGGLVGLNEYGHVENSYANVHVTATNYVGGLIGYSSQYNPPGSVLSSYATGDVFGDTYVGGLVGYARKETINDSYATGRVNGTNNIGGLVGFITSNTRINNSYATGRVNGTNYVGGLVGYGRYSGVDNSYAIGIVGGDEKIGGLIGETVECNVTNSSSTSPVFSAPAIVFIPDSVPDEELFVSDEEDYKSKKKTKEADFDTQNGVSQTCVGGLIGAAVATMVNDSYATGDLNTTDYSGGLVGCLMYYSNIDNSYATGSLTGNSSLGGLVGIQQIYSDIDNSYATGNLTGSENLGGLVGEANNASIDNSYATGDVTGNERTGGLIGYVEAANVSNSYSTGKVTGTTEIGGLIGEYDGGTLNNLYWYNGTNNPDYCIGNLSGSGSGNENCTAETDVTVFYDTADTFILYTTWNFTDIWDNFCDDEGYPTLQWQNLDDLDDCYTTAVCEDSDGDGYGDPASDTCEHRQKDCDDSDRHINPGADEDCNNNEDDDCDGRTDCRDSECKNSRYCEESGGAIKGLTFIPAQTQPPASSGDNEKGDDDSGDSGAEEGDPKIEGDDTKIGEGTEIVVTNSKGSPAEGTVIVTAPDGSTETYELIDGKMEFIPDQLGTWTISYTDSNGKTVTKDINVSAQPMDVEEPVKELKEPITAEETKKPEKQGDFPWIIVILLILAIIGIGVFLKKQKKI